MKKINSNRYGGKVCGVIAAFLLPLPLSLHLVAGLVALPVLDCIAVVSIGIGLVFLLLFIVYLMVELHQDKRPDRYYQQHRSRKVLLGNGGYECQTCGNKNLSKRDGYCSLCGTRFQNDQ